MSTPSAETERPFLPSCTCTYIRVFEGEIFGDGAGCMWHPDERDRRCPTHGKPRHAQKLQEVPE